MVGASGAISALFGLYALFFGRPKQVTANQKLNRWIHAAWLLATWIVLQWMSGHAGRRAGHHAGDAGAYRRVYRRPAAAAAAAAVAVPEGLARFGVLRPRNAVHVRLEQAVEVDHDIFHLGIVDGALGGAAPGFLGLGIAVEQADEVDLFEVGEFEAAADP